MCASGTVGLRYAYAFIAAGLADLVMVLGVEKLTMPTADEAILNMGTGVDREWEAAHGLTAPPCFALAAQAHMARHGTTEEQMAMVSVKNHNHAAKNPVRPLPEGRDARPGALLPHDRDPVPPVHVLAHHRRRGRRHRGERGARPRPDGPAGVDPRQRPGARRLHALVAPRGLRALARDEARRPGRVPHGRDRAGGRGPRRGARLLRDRGDHRLRGARLLRERGGRAASSRRASPTTAGRSWSTPAAASWAAAIRWAPPASRRRARPSGSSATRRARARCPARALALTHNNSGMGEHVVMIYGRDAA